MPKKLIKRYMPNPKKLYEIKGFKRFAHWFDDPNLWHLNRQSVAKGFFIGLFWMAIPMPWQMAAAAFFAILLRANLPLSVALVWISNPITMGPIFYFNYQIGALLLGEQAREHVSFALSIEWLTNSFVTIWQPLMLGSVTVGLVLAISSYLLVLLFWRIHVYLSWRHRLRNRINKQIFKRPKLTKPADFVHKTDQTP
ncbi:MAG: DUF2062 domain-containing protein [Thiomicrospira sp.]